MCPHPWNGFESVSPIKFLKEVFGESVANESFVVPFVWPPKERKEVKEMAPPVRMARPGPLITKE